MITCYITECIHNDNLNCTRPSGISIDWKDSRRYEAGERVCYPVCEDYEEREDDE